MKRGWFAVTAMLAAVLGAAACSSSGGGAASPASASAAAGSGRAGAASCPGGSGGGSTLTATAYAALAPAFVKQSDGSYSGYAVDLETAVAKELGCKIKFAEVAFAATIPGVQSGKFDIGSDVAPTAEREQVVDIVSMWQGSYTFVKLKSNARSVDAASDLCGLKIAIPSGAVFLSDIQAFRSACEKAGKSLTISNTPDQASAQLAVKSGRADLATQGTTQARTIEKEDPQLTFVDFTFATRHIGVALKKGSALTDAWAAAMDRLIKNGGYARILKACGCTDKMIPKAIVNETPAPAPSP